MPGGGAGLGEGGAVGDVGAGEVVGGAEGLALGAPAPSEMFSVTVVFGPSWIAETTVPAGAPAPWTVFNVTT